MQKKFVKPLDPNRPNTLPRSNIDGAKATLPAGSPKKARDEATQRQKLLEILSKTEEGQIHGRPDVLKQIEQRKVEETTHRKRREKEMFSLDHTSMETYALPGKPDVKALVPHDDRNSKGRTNRKIKSIEVSSDDMVDAAQGQGQQGLVEEYGFLSQALGTVRISTATTDPPPTAAAVVVKVASGGGSPTRTGGGATSARGGHTSDLDEISHIMAGLKTGEDTLNFFARYGSDTPVKFVNLLPVDDPKNYRPYDLVVTQTLGESDFEALVEHYTMSSAGIVHVFPGQPSECIPLTSWMRQGMIFKILRNIRFYKLFLHRKTFNIWKENVRFQLYAKQRKKIADRLYLTRKSSSAAIQTIKRHLMDIQNVKMLQLDFKTTDKNTFVEQQVAQCTKASSQFEEAMKQILLETQQVISDVNNLHSLANSDPDATVGPYNDNLVPEKAKSLVKVKQEKLDRKLARHKAYVEFHGLPDFVRFVDYLTVETFVALAVSTVHNFHEVFVKVDEKGRKTGIFETYIRFAGLGTSFSPTREDIREALEGLLDTMINSVGNINRVGYLSTGSKVAPVVGANIQHTIRESRRFRQMAESIQQRVIIDFAAADEHAKTFDTIRPIYDFNLGWDLDAYKAVQHDIQDIKEMFDMISNWNKELDKLRNKPIGVLEVDSKRLKAELFPMVGQRLSEIKDYTRELALQRCQQLNDHFKELLAKISFRPQHLKDFAGHVSLISSLREDEKALMVSTVQVDHLYMLLKQYEVPVPSQDQVLHEDLHEKRDEYRREVAAADSFKEGKLPEMVSAVDSNIAKLQDQLAAVVSRLDDPIYVEVDLFEEPARVLEEIAQLSQKLESADQLGKTYSGYQKLFGVSAFDQTELEAGTDKLENVKRLWDMVKSWQEKYNFWMESNFVELQVEEVDKEVQVFTKDIYALHKKLNTKVSEKLKDIIHEFKHIIPNVLDLGNPNMRSRHFERVFKLIKQNYFADMPFTLSMLLKGGIIGHAEAVAELSGAASGEAQLEQSLEKIKAGWEKTHFIVLNHRDQHNLFILGSLEDVLTLLEDNQVTLQTMLGSRFIRGIQDRVEEWEKKLSTLSETLDEWILCQRTWMYLENIFGAEDIQKQLPAESQKFLVVDRSWKTIMARTNQDDLVINCLNPLDHGMALLDQFKMNNGALDSIQKSLEEYLETKRMAFPRFYFLSNDELLEILSQTRDPLAVQPHMGKCFDAIKRIKFGEGRQSHEMQGFIDPGAEVVTLTEFVKAEGPVEGWLLSFEKAMRFTLYSLCKHAYQNYPKTDEGAIDRKEWLWAYPAQVVIAIDQVTWTQNVADALRRLEGIDDDAATSQPEAMINFLDFSLKQIQAMVDLVRAPLDRQQRTLLGALLTIDVHARDVIRTLVTKAISSLSDFEWTKQLRYYWEEKEDDVFAKQTNSSFRYGYEYLGNGPRLVITPLTDTCYMTLTGALHMRLGGAPAGPAGTGKTETTKDLAKALAVYCVVFNCSDGLDYKIMGRFFSGLAQQGAWACFDEFNRIDIEVLSVIAQQILCIQQAIVKRAKEFDFEGKMIPLNFAFGVFITMNPGYAGRTELPDNLKSLFRPVAMMVPDYRLIAEIMLFSEGFANALPLSNKMAQLYALSSEQLSKQSHYDFGMRAVKSVLVAAGQLKRKEPETNEDLLLIRAMRDSNVPKFLEQDLPLFGGILSDLFPGIKVPYVDYGKLQQAIEKTLETMHLQKVSTFITKVIQVHETQLVRHGMMVVGESGSGKSTNIKVLAAALAALYEEKIVDRDGFYKIVDCLILNPKSITAGELYGEFNLLTNEWKDGIVPKLVRDCVNALNEGSDNRKWIIFDGPVDAVWIENMNTVLDDNKTLCLSNSERIKLPNTLHMLFEVQDLKVASPATVSRCGMVYMEQVHVGMNSLVRTWGITTFREIAGLKTAKTMVSAIEEYLPAAVDFLRYECKEKVATSNNQLTASLIHLIEGELVAEEEPKQLTQDRELMNALLVWCIVWSIGANIVDASRSKFSEWVRAKLAPLVTSRYASLLEDPYGCFVDLTAREIKPWSEIMPEFKYNPDLPYFGILVPTMDTTRYRFILDKLMNAGHNVLLMAETGVGKSVVVNSFLNDMVATGKTVSYVVGYSAQTKPSNLRDVFDSKLEKKRKNLLGPPAGKKMFMFIDDLNMPALETYGAQPPNELLRQVIDQGGFFDFSSKIPFFKHVQDLVFAAACAPPGGGRNEVSPRLLRHFHMVWLTNLSVQSMSRIFASILSGFLNAYLPEFEDLAEPLVQSSVDIYMRIQKELLPTPAKSHYTFNLRDLSKVFQGVLMVKPKNLPDRDSLIRLWCHEGARVFRDRLISEEDSDWFNDATLHQLHTALGAKLWEKADFVDCLYGNFLTRTDKEYKELKDRAKVQEVLVEYLEEYNVTFPSRMELVFFRDAVNHVARIARMLSQPRGNGLLVGVGGSGRQSLSRMAAFMADYKCRQIEITRGYGVNEWHENLKEILINAGAKNLPTVFLFSDTQIVTETFLEDINNILNSGEVPNLYEADELEKIVGMVRPLAKKAGKLETRDAVLQHYVYLVRENLHIVLCMSPIGAGFRTRCRMFPSLVNCCTIDWFSAWPEDALYSVAQRTFDARSELGIADHVAALSTMCTRMHMTVKVETDRYFHELKRYNYTTPTSYLELIKLYTEVLKTQQEKIASNERRYRIGLDKLRETEEIVAKLEIQLTDMQPVLIKASKDTEKLLIQVTADQKDADAQAAVVEVDVQEANKVAASVKIIKDDCQKDLDAAMPAYESALKALATLDKKSVQELKAFNNPPEMVKFTLEAVCILLERAPDWGEAKKLLSQLDFMDQLRMYDKDNIPPRIIKKVDKYYKDPRFQPDQIKAVSSAAMCLCMWVRAMVVYDSVAKGIEPKKAALKEAEDQLAATTAELNAKKKSLQLVLDRVALLQRTLKDTQDKKADLEAQADRAKKQLVRAGQLIGGLGGEKVRWQESAAALNASLTNLVGDMCLAAGFLSYLGTFTAQFRQRIVKVWIKTCKELNIPCSDFTLLKALGDPVLLRSWQIDGLPADDFSSENGLLTTMGRRWPLMIDPQGQANRWIRNTYASKNLQIIKLTEKDFLRTLENGIRYGAPVLLENIGQELDPSLEPVLLKQVFKRGGQNLLRLGDTDVPYSEEFKFLITTKLANPHYMPEVCIKVTVINFTVTMKGLEDQLLVDVIKSERPDLEEKKDSLVVSIANDQRQLRDIEEEILSMLANASGNILDDEELINALGRSKTTSIAINGRLAEAEHTTLEINEIREGYRVVATRGSVIYFVVANLALVDPMYQYSLQFYKELFNQRLLKTEKKDVLQERLQLLIDDITKSIYANVCRGLFEKDKLLYAFTVAAKIFVAAGSVSDNEWLMFMVGATPDSTVTDKHPLPEELHKLGVHEKNWAYAIMLEIEQKEAFSGLLADMEKSPEEWSKFFTCDAPYREPLPGAWESKLTSFQRLLLVRVVREEKVVFAIRRFVGESIGEYFTESPPFDLEGAYGDSTSVTPLIFILSPGADPTDYLLQLAEAQGKGGTGLRIISLGQGQGPIAERALEMSMMTGDWVCLQNCHLAVSWLAKLEQTVEKMQNEPGAVNPNFRLWLTSMPSANFPVPVLQNGIKVTNEPPRGLRSNLTRTFTDISSDEYESCMKPEAYKKLIFSTAFFNALILERRKFGAVGWNIPYEWMQSDLKAAMAQVRMYVEEQASVPWETLNVSVADITYGGRVTDIWDKRAISSILRKYFDPQLLDDSYNFTDNGVYQAPVISDIHGVREYIRQLPVEDHPEVFGLHSNAAINFQQKESRALIATVVTCAGSGGGGSGGGDSSDSRVREAASKIAERMPQVFDLRHAHPETFKRIGDAMISLGVFLSQELMRFNALIEVMTATLRELQRAIAGEVVMSKELEVMYNCVVFQSTPPSWVEVGYPCLKPLPSWVEDFFLRIDFMSKWLTDGPRLCYWLPGFFFPQGFMTSVKQTYSRDFKIAVDTLRIGCEMTSFDYTDITEAPSTGAYVYGLFMEGGRFSRETMTMSESLPRQLLDPMPCIWLKPVIAASYSPQGCYNVPLYKTSIRAGTLSTTGHSTNFVVSLPVPTTADKSEDHWIRRGCAMLCMTDE